MASLALFFRFRRLVLLAILLITLALLWHFRTLLYLTWTLLSLPLTWFSGGGKFLISQEADGFDLSFENYSTTQTTAGPGFTDHVPAILHHIMLGKKAKPSESWNEARQSCIDWHPDWESILWTDENAEKLVADKFPDFKPTWDAYTLPIQRVDALRYMILYEYGGAILDMDVQCRRALGPLRRFEFVAPAAYPTGFSVSFLMSSKHSEFLGILMKKLKDYDRQWFYLPYVTVMFSTGGHFASAVHVLEPNRADYKVLAGPPDNYKLHSLNGRVSTPLFNHLGSSSWHSFDGLFIMSLGKYLKWMGAFFIIGTVVGLFCVLGRPSRWFRRRWRTRSGSDLEGLLEFEKRDA